MNAMTSMDGRTFGRGIRAALTALIVDRPFTPARRARLRAALERLASIMSDKPLVCDDCGGNVYVCRIIGCDPEGAARNTVSTALLMSGS